VARIGTFTLKGGYEANGGICRLLYMLKIAKIDYGYTPKTIAVVL
jgi:hypothetical protein